MNPKLKFWFLACCCIGVSVFWISATAELCNFYQKLLGKQCLDSFIPGRTLTFVNSVGLASLHWYERSWTTIWCLWRAMPSSITLLAAYARRVLECNFFLKLLSNPFVSKVFYAHARRGLVCQCYLILCTTFFCLFSSWLNTPAESRDLFQQVLCICGPVLFQKYFEFFFVFVKSPYQSYSFVIVPVILANWNLELCVIEPGNRAKSAETFNLRSLQIFQLDTCFLSFFLCLQFLKRLVIVCERLNASPYCRWPYALREH